MCNCVIFVRVGSSLDGRAACLYVCVSFGARMCVIKVNGSVAAGYVSLSFLSLSLSRISRPSSSNDIYNVRDDERSLTPVIPQVLVHAQIYVCVYMIGLIRRND